MEAGSERRREIMRSIQKEQERERRRIRDRQRRQSMSVEEREKHLARRRRNYQLRRLRAENSRFPSAANVNNVHLQCSNGLTSVGLEIPADKLAELPARLRLNHLKHLARSLDRDRRNASSDLIINGNEIQNHIANTNSNSTCVTAKCGLRLNRVKRLARSLTSDLEKSTSRKEVEQKNLLNGEVHQLHLLSVTSNLSSVVDQPYLVSCGNE